MPGDKQEFKFRGAMSISNTHFIPMIYLFFSSVFMLNKCSNPLKVHTYDQVIHLVELCKIGGKTATETVTVF